MESELSVTDSHIEQLNVEIAKLQQKLSDAKAKKKALMMRTQTVESRIKVKRQVNREALDDAFSRFEHFERRMDNLESQLEVMDMGKDVAPSLAAEINALQEDEKLTEELERLKAEVSGRDSPA